jgi:D-alanyl-D-alanine carboxypeptidase
VVGVIAVFAGRALLSGDAEGAPTPSTTASSTGARTTPADTTAPPTTPATPVVAGLPPCQYGSLPAPEDGYGRWQRTLLDTTFALPDTYFPSDLVSVTNAGFESEGVVRSLVIPDLTALLRASERAGNPVDVLVPYRSYATQQQLFLKHVQELGKERALAKTARPGHSEHQLGTTIDFRTKGQLDVDEGWESEPAGAWMSANAWKFGFVLSYPKGREDVTCYGYEPWHYRYFGRPLAKRIHDSGLTPREFLWRLDAPDEPPATTAPTTGDGT